MSNTYNDPVKQKSREKIRDFIKRNMQHKQPSEIKVVCFPGAEKEGEEAIEVKEIYDPLGIPRQNIVGLERGREESERLRRANLGIEVICADAYDFFKQTDRKFDVIFLDYKGLRNWKERDTTRYIAGKGLLENRGIFGSVHFGARESEKMQDYMKRISYGPDELILAAFGGKPLRNIDSEQMRTGAITGDLLRVFSGGEVELNPKEHWLKNMNQLKEFRSYYEAFKQDLPVLEQLARESTNLGFDFKSLRGIESDTMWGIYKAEFILAMSKAGKTLNDMNMPFNVTQSLLRAVNLHKHRGYAATDIERYSYVSNKGGKMLIDLMKFENMDYKIANKIDNLFRINSSTGTVMINIGGKTLRQYSNLCNDVYLQIENRYFSDIDEMPQRIDLGSSFKPKKILLEGSSQDSIESSNTLREVISREDAVSLLESGFKSTEIASLYNGFTSDQLAGIKAAMTLKKRKEAQAA